MKLWVRKRRFWWTATDPNQVVCELDTPSYVRARTRERAIEKATRRWGPRNLEDWPWEEIDVATPEGQA